MPTRTITIAAIVTAVMAVVIALLAAAVLTRVGDSDEPPRTIRVSGSGEAFIAPDHATVTATAEARDPAAEVALKEADKRMERVLAAVRDVGIDDDQLTTAGVQTHREHRPPRPVDGDEREQPRDWVATITLRIEIDDLDLAGRVLAAANEAGAQRITGPAYSVREPQAAYADALEQAMRDARDKADTIAKQAGAEVGEVRTVEEGDRPGPVYGATTAAAGADMERSEIDVRPGETERVQATVTVVFEHEDGD